MAEHISLKSENIVDIYLDKTDKEDEIKERGPLSHPKYFIAIDHD